MPPSDDAITLPNTAAGGTAADPRPLWRRVAGFVRRLGPAGPLAMAATILPGIGGLVIYRRLPTVGPWLRSHEASGPWICAAVFGTVGGMALIPTYAMSVLCGWSFGFSTGLVATLCGFVLAAVVGYGLSRALDKGRAIAVVDASARWRKVRGVIMTAGFGKLVLIVALVRLAPAAPFSLTNVAMAAMRVPIPSYALGTLLGMAPRTAILVFAGSRAADLAQLPNEAPWVWAAGVALTAVVVVALARIGKYGMSRMMEADRREEPD